MHKKWIIFIIIVVVVTLIVVGVKNVGFSSDFYLDAPYEDDDSARDVVMDSTVRIVNVSEYAVSPGVLVLHSPSFTMNFLGERAPDAYELLAEVGDPTAVLASLNDSLDVYDVFEVGLLEPDGSQLFAIPPTASDVLISYMAMIVQTNDGVAWLNGLSLYDEDGGRRWDNVFTEILDMGTEQNSPVGSGFAGGQPDLSRGAENIDNGVSTSGTVNHHLQFYGGSAASSSVVRIDLNS